MCEGSACQGCDKLGDPGAVTAVVAADPAVSRDVGASKNSWVSMGCPHPHFIVSLGDDGTPL